MDVFDALRFMIVQRGTVITLSYTATEEFRCATVIPPRASVLERRPGVAPVVIDRLDIDRRTGRFNRTGCKVDSGRWIGPYPLNHFWLLLAEQRFTKLCPGRVPTSSEAISSLPWLFQLPREFDRKLRLDVFDALRVVLIKRGVVTSGDGVRVQLSGYPGRLVCRQTVTRKFVNSAVVSSYVESIEVDVDTFIIKNLYNAFTRTS